MAIEFKYFALDPFNPPYQKEYTEYFPEGSLIRDVQFQVDELPQGVPTRRFNLIPTTTGTYNLIANVAVEASRINLQNYNNPPDTHSVHNAVFQTGLAARVNIGNGIR